MQRACPKPKPVKRGKTKFKGIGNDAAILGVNRATLRRVLSGQWKSESLLKRFAALKMEQRKTQHSPSTPKTNAH